MGAVAMRGTVVDMEGSLVGAKLAEAEGRMAEVGMAVDAGVATGWTLWRASPGGHGGGHGGGGGHGRCGGRGKGMEEVMVEDSEGGFRLADMGVGHMYVGMEVGGEKGMEEDSEEELRLADMGVGMEVPVGMEVGGDGGGGDGTGGDGDGKGGGDGHAGGGLLGSGKSKVVKALYDDPTTLLPENAKPLSADVA
ncbi:hypothetical protein CYMTET_6786 [Cymbomonas tetramitiformis]|uniref:Uncharacterized protein n=1 Tax=Cymbomonas tetramitiformis TaxID=36881 RepID=A0AAE0GWD7_9CHLO|nr:hypothetical protein CYMTET_6786 [Cymbomonas tetramitiformis]